MIPNNWFRDHSPAQITAKVTELTLAVISQWAPHELERVGWSNNDVIDKLYELADDGIWQSRIDSVGFPYSQKGAPVPHSSPEVVPVGGTTETEILGDGEYGQIMSFYQGSGANRDFVICNSDGSAEYGGKTAVGTGQHITPMFLNGGMGNILLGPIYAKWSDTSSGGQVVVNKLDIRAREVPT